MNTLEQILLFLYFPQFKSPASSRFEAFFQNISKKELSRKKKANKSKTIYPEKIVRNEDKRTSLIIKGIPSDIPKKDVRNLIEKYGNINYLYITKDLKNKENKDTSFVFINVINYKTSFDPEKAETNWEKDDIILGIDEAGRGPVMGPMVYACAYWKE